MRCAGFSIVEMLVAATIALVAASAVFALIDRAFAAVQAQPEAADVQQRTRVAADALVGDLLAAGSGPDRGPRAGSLLQSFPPILPFRSGSTSDDPPGSYFTDRITIRYVPVASPHATLAAAGPPLDSDWIGVDPQPQCPPIDPLCLFSVGTAAAIFDDSGQVDLVTLTAIASTPPAPSVQHAAQPLAFAAYDSPATAIVGVANVVYSLDRSSGQLRVANGLRASDAPLADNVADLVFSYLGDPQPPQLGTYGPQPPPIGVQGPNPSWPPGENCAFAVEGTGEQGVHVPRLPVLGGGSTLVPLSASQLTDGPWCPDPSSSARWDADLLRIRAVSVTLRVQAAVAALRGPASTLFASAGTGRDPARWVADRQVAFRVAPRSMNLGRAP